MERPGDRGFKPWHWLAKAALIVCTAVPSWALLVNRTGILDAPPGLVAGAGACLLAWFGGFYTARFLTHIRLDGYLHWRGGRLHKVLVVVLALEGLTAAAFLIAGPLLVLEFRGAERGAIELAVATVLLVWVGLLGVALAELVRILDLETGSDNAWRCRAVKVLVRIADWLNLEKLSEWFLKRTHPEHVSASVFWTLFGLLFVMLANAPAVAPIASDSLDPPIESKLAKGLVTEVAKAAEVSSAQTAVRSPDPREIDPEPSGPSPDHERLCGAEGPGSRAPEPQRSYLHSQWLGEGGLGAIFGGCANAAHRVGTSETYYAAGTCGSELRSLAVAGPAGGGIVRWEAARFALERAHDGTLRGVSTTAPVGTGDIAAVTTDTGTFVFVRRSLSGGSRTDNPEPQSCHDIEDRPAGYLRMPPAFAALWLQATQAIQAWFWPRGRGSVLPARRFVLTPEDPGVATRPHGECDDDTHCSMWVAGRKSRIENPGPVDMERVMEFAPSPAPADGP